MTRHSAGISRITGTATLLAGAVALSFVHAATSAPGSDTPSASATSSIVHPIVFEPVVREMSSGWVDWSNMVLHTAAEAYPAPGPLADRTLVEQQARDLLGPALKKAALGIHVSSQLTASDIMQADDSTARLMKRGINSWRVTEARYFTSGRVELEAELDLSEWLMKALTNMAEAERPANVDRSRTTGVVVDARGLDFTPTAAPSLLSDNGQQLYGIRWITPAALKKHSPAQYVSDPADPLAQKRAGANPIFLRAVKVKGDFDLVLDTQSSIRLRTSAQDPHLLAEARVVLVTDP